MKNEEPPYGRGARERQCVRRRSENGSHERGFRSNRAAGEPTRSPAPDGDVSVGGALSRAVLMARHAFLAPMYGLAAAVLEVLLAVLLKGLGCLGGHSAVRNCKPTDDRTD